MRISLGLDVTGAAALWKPGGAGGAASTWSPLDLGTALRAWWNADDHGTVNMTDDGAGLISAWKDRISGVNLTATTTARPTWAASSFNTSYAGVTFNGTTNTLATTAFTALPTGATAGNIAIMVSQNSSAGPLFFLFGYGQEGIHSRNVGGYPTGGIGHLNIGDSNTQLDDTSASFIGNHLAVGEWSGTTMRGWLDGSATNPASASTISINTATSGGCRIGSRMESATFFFTGVVRHIFVTTVLTTLQRQQLEGWLAWDSGLQSLLPVGHPYKSTTFVRPWMPTDLGAALKAWWNADNHALPLMTDDGAGLISNWVDRAGGMAVTGTTTARPTWASNSFNSAYAGLTFDGVANTLVSTALTTLPTGATAGEMFAVASNTDPGTAALYIVRYGGGAASTDRALGKANGASARWRALDATVTTDVVNPLFTGPHFGRGEWSGTTQVSSIDGGAGTGPATGTIATLNTGTTRLRIGAAAGTSAAGWWIGVIRHVLVTTTLTTLQRQQMEGWMAWNSGLQSLLPAAHPYKSARP